MMADDLIHHPEVQKQKKNREAKIVAFDISGVAIDEIWVGAMMRNHQIAKHLLELQKMHTLEVEDGTISVEVFSK